MTPTQTLQSSSPIPIFANLWAATFAVRRTQVTLELTNEDINVFSSWINGPAVDISLCWLLSILTTLCESISTCTFSACISCAKTRPFLHAWISSISGSVMPRTKWHSPAQKAPCSSLITAPAPPFLPDLDTAPSELSLSHPSSGGFHFCLICCSLGGLFCLDELRAVHTNYAISSRWIKGGQPYIFFVSNHISRAVNIGFKNIGSTRCPFFCHGSLYCFCAHAFMHGHISLYTYLHVFYHIGLFLQKSYNFGLQSRMSYDL